MICKSWRLSVKDGENHLRKCGHAQKYFCASSVGRIVVGLALCMAALLVMYFFRADILMATVPKEYALYAMSATAGQLEEETKDIRESLLGFELNPDTDFTLTNKIKISHVPMPFDGVSLSYAPSRNALYTRAENAALLGEKVTMNVLWNNTSVGLNIPEITNDLYFAIDSANFGNQLMNTKFAPVSDFVKKNNISCGGADISFDSVFGDRKLSEKEISSIKKKLARKTKEFIKNARVKKCRKFKSGNYKGAYVLVINFENTKEYISECVKLLEKEEALKRKYGNVLKSYLQKLRKKLNNESNPIDVKLKLIIENDRVVLLETLKPIKEVGIKAGFASHKTMLDNFSFALTTSDYHFAFNTDGNIIPKDSKVNYRINVKNLSNSFALGINMNFDTGKAGVLIDTGNKQAITLKGICSCDNGFQLLVNSGNEVIDFALVRGAQIAPLPGSEYMILEKSTVKVGWDMARTILRNKIAGNIIKKILGEIPERKEELSENIPNMTILPDITSALGM